MIVSPLTAGNVPGAAPVASPPGLPDRYVRVPQRLLAAAAYQPLHAGIYSLVARLFLVAQAPVPLSAADIVRYDPSLSRGAAQRALGSLVDGGWLIPGERPGHKTTYVPGWGRVSGELLPWRIGAPCLNRPRHVRAVCLDLRMLDLFLGRLTPHPKRAALITRYVSAPLLALADVGAYALLLGGFPGATPRLIAWDLARDDLPLPLPDDNVILARASQQTLYEADGAALTTRGMQKAGLIPSAAAPDVPQPLFFVPPNLTGKWPIRGLTNLIGRADDDEMPFEASQRPNQDRAAVPGGITWESTEIQRNKEESPPIPPAHDVGGGGRQSGRAFATGKRKARKAETASLPARPEQPPADTEAARALQAINVLPRQIAELADMPIAMIDDAIRDGQARPYIRDLAGWVVTLLRAYRDHGWKIAPPSPSHDSPEALGTYFGRLAAEQEAARMREQAIESDTVNAVDEEGAIVVPAPAEEVPGSTPPPSLDCAWTAALDMLKLRMPRQAFAAWLQPARLVAMAGDVATIAVAGAGAKEGVEHHYCGMLRDVLGEVVGRPIATRIVIVAPESAPARAAIGPVAGSRDTGTDGGEAALLPASDPASFPPAPGADGRPDWIGEEQWETLPPLLRAALRGATLVEGTVTAASPHLTRLLQVRYASAIESLVADDAH